MQRRSFLAVVGAAPFDLTLSDVMAATPDPWAAGFAAARAQYPWLAGYQGVSADMPSRALKVEGAFPPALRGAFYRNGPARHEIGGVRYHHLFDGDGLIQRYDISEQGVTHRGVFVRTDKFVADTAAGRPLRATFGTARPDMEPVTSSDSINAANTSLVMHGDEMLALWEGGSATRVDPNSLRTRGVQIWHDDYKGMPFSAHPKVEPDGTLWNFGVSSAAGLLTVYCVGADSALKRVESVKVPDVAMVHDFAVTQQHLVFLLPPFVYDVERMHAGMSFLDSHVWRPELGMRVLVLDKNDITRMRWLQLPAGFVFHLGNAWSSPDGQEIHLDYIRSDDATVVTTSLRELMRGQIRPAPGAHLAQVRLNLPTGRAEQVSTGHVAEFPKIDTRRTAQRHRTLFMVAYTAPPAGGGGPEALPGYDTVMRFDADSGQVQQYRFGHRTLVEEHVFVPASATAREGQGWLVGTVFDADGGCTRLTAFDAQNVGAGPVAMASLDGVAPLGLHGLFRAA